MSRIGGDSWGGRRAGVLRTLFALAFLFATVPVAFGQSAVLLPNGKQQFLDGNGAPLAAGTVGTYIPSTTTPKTTWQDPAEATPNTNPIPLDSAGEALIYGNGAYRQIVKDTLGNTIWDAVTAGLVGPFPAYGGTSSGTANAQIVALSSWSASGGAQLVFKVGGGLTNTGATTLTIGSSTFSVVKDVSSGPSPLTGGELVAGNLVLVTYDAVAGNLHVSQSAGLFPFVGTQTSIAGAGTVDLGTASATHSVLVTGSAWTITSFGSTASVSGGALYLVVFNSTGTITYNATSLITPGAASISVTAGSSAFALYLGGGNWRIVQYTSAGYTAYKLLGVQTFSASGTYTPSAGVVFIRAMCLGGGGAGAGLSSPGSGPGAAGGGGQGATSFYIGANTASQTVTIGIAGTTNSGTTGTAGGDTSLGSLCVGKGGSPGNTNGLGGLGGSVSSSTGTIKFGGASGTPGAITTYINATCSNDNASGGTGGGDGGAIGAFIGSSGAGTAPAAATGFGAGGGGGAGCGSGTAQGSNGSAGFVQVEEYGL